ncbi:MAG: hypothetical protein ACXVES_05390 [Actinomycetota bacterium]
MSVVEASNPRAPDPNAEWSGEYRRYDLVKEFVIALAVVTLITILLAALLSSPDVRPLTIQGWANADAKDFLTTSVSELDGSSGIAQYGPPYNSTAGAAQKIGPIDLQGLPGVRIPVDTAQAFVLGPLSLQAAKDAALEGTITTYKSAGAAQQKTWTDEYTSALDSMTLAADGTPVVDVPASNPVGSMMTALYTQARTGGLDGALLTSRQFYQTDYTKPLLFMSDGSYLESLAEQQHLTGEQWGMMNETGLYPGQAWLWLYTFWYQIPPFSHSGNADALIWGIMVVLTLVLVLVPLIPGLRALPERLGVYRVIWRNYYRRVEGR